MAELQTTVLVDGQWVTRSQDVYALLANNRNAERNQHAAHATPQKPVMPKLGMLANTIARSPVIRWILPARIRSKSQSDVIFVGQDFIHLKEVTSDGRLLHVATKSDFDTRIRAAGVFGNPYRPKRPQNAHSSTEAKKYGVEMLIDMDADIHLPFQVLMLALESREFLFVFALDLWDGHVQFFSSSMPLPMNNNILDLPGQHLAVDPMSRAVAIAASQRTLILYKSKDMKSLIPDLAADIQARGYEIESGTMPATESMRRERRANGVSQSTGPWSPFSQELKIEVEGAILKIEFLHPMAGDENHVILLVIFRKNSKTQMRCWNWDHSIGLSSISVANQGQRLDSAESFPNLVIPLSNYPDFFLISESSVSLYSGILAGPPTQTPLKLQVSSSSWKSDKPPLWTSWARASRTEQSPNECFYLAREDGALNYLQITMKGRLPCSSDACQIDCGIDSAFASLLVDYMTPDVLISAGNGGTGQLVKIGAFKDEGAHHRGRALVMTPEIVETFPNWSPTMDIVAIRGRSSDQRDIFGGRPENRDVLMAACGKEPYGTLCSIFWGFKPHMLLDPEDIEDFEFVSSMWAIPINGGAYIVCSHPVDTGVMAIDIDAPDLQIYDIEDFGPTAGTSTVLASPLSRNFAVQVTPESVNVLTVERDRNVVVDRVLDYFDNVGLSEIESSFDGCITAAAISPVRDLILTAKSFVKQHGMSSQVSLIHLHPEGDKLHHAWVGEPLQFKRDVTCLAFIEATEGLFALVGLTFGGIRLLRVDMEDGLQLLDVPTLPSIDRGDGPSTCDSAVILTYGYHCITQRLVLGLRTGGIWHADFRVDAKGVPYLSSPQRVQLAYSSVKLIEHPSERPQKASALCDGDVWELGFSDSKPGTFSVDRVWYQKKISALTMIPGKNGGHITFTASSTPKAVTLMVSTLDRQPEVVTKKIPVEGSPQKIMYRERDGLLLVASTCSRAEPVTSVRNSVQSKTSTQTVITAFDDRSIEPGRGWSTELLPFERVYDMTEWCYSTDAREYRFIVAVTGIYRPTESPIGRVLFMKPEERTKDRSSWIRTYWNYPEPIYALGKGTGPSDELIMGLDDKVIVRRFQIGDGTRAGRWVDVASCSVPSTAIAITRQEQYILVSTAKDSIAVFELGDSLRLISSDDSPRGAWHHLILSLPIPETNPLPSSSLSPSSPSQSGQQSTESSHAIILQSDKHGSLTLNDLAPASPLRIAHSPLAEGRTPRSILRLRRFNTRPGWRSAPPAGTLLDNILGISADGSLITVKILDEPALRLARYLSTLLEWASDNYSDKSWRILRDVATVSISDNDTSHSSASAPMMLQNQASRQPGHSHSAYVDGDFLSRLIRPVSHLNLRYVVDEAEREHGGQTAVLRRLLAKVMERRRGHEQGREGSRRPDGEEEMEEKEEKEEEEEEEEAEDDVVGAAERWLWDLLQEGF